MQFEFRYSGMKQEKQKQRNASKLTILKKKYSHLKFINNPYIRNSEIL